MLNANEFSLVGEWLFSAGKITGDRVCQRIERLVANHLIERARSADGWSTLYQDPTDGRLWEHTYPQGHLQGGGPPAVTSVTPADSHSRYAFPVKAPASLSQGTLQALAPLSPHFRPLVTSRHLPTSQRLSAISRYPSWVRSASSLSREIAVNSSCKGQLPKYLNLQVSGEPFTESIALQVRYFPGSLRRVGPNFSFKRTGFWRAA